jgi:hypothetical protein
MTTAEIATWTPQQMDHVLLNYLDLDPEDEAKIYAEQARRGIGGE